VLRLHGVQAPCPPGSGRAGRVDRNAGATIFPTNNGLHWRRGHWFEITRWNLEIDLKTIEALAPDQASLSAADIKLVRPNDEAPNTDH